MKNTSQELYKLHTANNRRVTDALEQTARTIRSHIASKNMTGVATFVPLYILLLAAWAECRLRKLLYEKDAFSTDDRKSIESKQTHFDRWSAAVDLVFRRRYRIPKASLSANLPFSAASKYDEIQDLLKTDLKPIIQIRNKLAHGQWEYPLTNAGDAVATELLTLLRTENLLTLQIKKSLLSSLLDIVHDLAVSEPAFERDFDTHYRQISAARTNLRSRRYSQYEKTLVEKRRRGLTKRVENTSK